MCKRNHTAKRHKRASVVAVARPRAVSPQLNLTAARHKNIHMDYCIVNLCNLLLELCSCLLSTRFLSFPPVPPAHQDPLGKLPVGPLQNQLKQRIVHSRWTGGSLPNWCDCIHYIVVAVLQPALRPPRCNRKCSWRLLSESLMICTFTCLMHLIETGW